MVHGSWPISVKWHHLFRFYHLIQIMCSSFNIARLTTSHKVYPNKSHSNSTAVHFSHSISIKTRAFEQNIFWSGIKLHSVKCPVRMRVIHFLQRCWRYQFVEMSLFRALLFRLCVPVFFIYFICFCLHPHNLANEYQIEIVHFVIVFLALNALILLLNFSDVELFILSP